MTSITLTVTGAKARATVNGPLTSGMVGIPVTIEYDDEWNGLTKNLVCRCGKWGPDKGETRTIVNVGETATVAHEVMKADTNLYLGIEGYSTNGDLVMPTTWAECGKIQHGANAGADPSANPKLSVWAQLQAEISQLGQHILTEERIAAVVEAYLEKNHIEAPDSSQNGNGMSDTVKTLLITILRDGVYSTDQSANITALETALGSSGDDSGSGEDSGSGDSGETEVTLVSISVNYLGGDVPVGTAVTDLTDLGVVAHYSDGTSQALTEYSISGKIEEGENTVMVRYGGKVATFTVIGIAVSSGENNGWTEGEAYAIEWTDGYGIDHNGTQGGGAIGAVFGHSSRSVSGFMPCRGASALNVSGIYTNYGIFFYDENQEFVIIQKVSDYTAPVPVPLTAYYVRVQCFTTNKANATVTPVMLDTLNESTAYETGVHYCLEWEYGKSLNGDTGIETTHTSTARNVSKFALCMGATTITFSHKLRSLAVFYDADRNFISSVIFDTTFCSTTIPENAVYFRYDTYGYANNMNVTVMLS